MTYPLDSCLIDALDLGTSIPFCRSRNQIHEPKSKQDIRFKKVSQSKLEQKVQIGPLHLPNHHSKEQHGKELKNGQVNIVNSASSFTRIPNTELPWLLIIIGHFESFFSVSKALWIKIEKVIFLIRYSDLGIVRESETVN